MKEIKVTNKKKPVKVAEWKDVKHIVKRIIREERRFLSAMANL